MEAFEPPKYLSSLIAAVNDGAKSAQAGAFLFLLVGLYLLATAFSASDEDLLLGKAVTISQIGASLPVSFSFAIAPLVFVFLHINTLVRYDLLAKNVQHYRTELRNTVPLEADRERCRQLLHNFEFIVALTAPRRSALYSRFWPWLFRGIIAVFPVAVLLLVQINALRYQSDDRVGAAHLAGTRPRGAGLVLCAQSAIRRWDRAGGDLDYPARGPLGSGGQSSRSRNRPQSLVASNGHRRSVSPMNAHVMNTPG
jgi:hypothetical protein